MKKPVTTLAALKARREKFLAKKAAAERALADATSMRAGRRIADDLDDAADADLQVKVDRAKATLDGWLEDLGSLDRQIQETQTIVEAEAAAAKRKTSSEKILNALAGIDAAFPNFKSAALALSTRLDGVIQVSPETTAIISFLNNAVHEIDTAIAFVIPDVKATAGRILRGEAPVPSPPPTQPDPVKILPAPAATKRVFATKNLKWTNGGGGVHVAPAWFDVDLPPAAAERALNSGAAVDLNHPTRKKMHGQRPISHPAPANCLPLTDDAEAVSSSVRGKGTGGFSPPVSHHSAFTPLDRGATVTGTLGLGDALDRGGNL